MATSEGDLLEMGWAPRKSRSTQRRFSKKVSDCLQKKFEIGQQTGRKEDPAQVADDMRRARNANGERMFTRTEWITKLQVQSFSSRLSARQRLTGQKEFTRDEVTDDLDEESEEEHASRQDENVMKFIMLSCLKLVSSTCTMCITFVRWSQKINFPPSKLRCLE